MTTRLGGSDRVEESNEGRAQPAPSSMTEKSPLSLDAPLTVRKSRTRFIGEGNNPSLYELR